MGGAAIAVNRGSSSRLLPAFIEPSRVRTRIRRYELIVSKAWSPIYGRRRPSRAGLLLYARDALVERCSGRPGRAISRRSPHRPQRCAPPDQANIHIFGARGKRVRLRRFSATSLSLRFAVVAVLGSERRWCHRRDHLFFLFSANCSLFRIAHLAVEDFGRSWSRDSAASLGRVPLEARRVSVPLADDPPLVTFVKPPPIHHMVN